MKLKTKLKTKLTLAALMPLFAAIIVILIAVCVLVKLYIWAGFKGVICFVAGVCFGGWAAIEMFKWVRGH